MNRKKQKKVVYVNYGLGNSYPDHIEINKLLKKDKKLRDYVIRHELDHTDYSIDIMHEFKSIDLMIMPSLLRFIFWHPSTWIDFSPLQYRNKKFVWDINLLILYSVSIFLIILLVLMLK